MLTAFARRWQRRCFSDHTWLADSAVLTCVISIVLHLFLWIVVWLFLTVKQGWTFKLRVTVGKNVVRAARSIKLLNDVDLKEEAEG